MLRGQLHLLEHLVPLLYISFPLLLVLNFVSERFVDFLPKLLLLGLELPRKHLIFLEQTLTLPFVLTDLAARQFAPFLKKLHIVILRFLLYQFVVGVHFPHERHVPFMHLLHVLLYALDVLPRKFQGHHRLGLLLRSERACVLETLD